MYEAHTVGASVLSVDVELTVWCYDSLLRWRAEGRHAFHHTEAPEAAGYLIAQLYLRRRTPPSEPHGERAGLAVVSDRQHTQHRQGDHPPDEADPLEGPAAPPAAAEEHSPSPSDES